MLVAAAITALSVAVQVDLFNHAHVLVEIFDLDSFPAGVRLLMT